MDNNQLIREYCALLERHKVISFDVFDTLIHRTLHRPADLFAVAGAQLAHSEFGLHYPQVATSFAEKRVEAETTARQRLLKSMGSPEVDFNEIYDVLAELLALDEEQRTYLQTLELSLEESFCHPNPVMRALFQQAGNDGRRVVLCSDMYLPGRFIKKLLDNNGYTQNYQLLVSSELRKSKHEGSLFDDMLQQFGVKPGEVLHFGDNAHADVEMAGAAGIKPHFFNYLHSQVEPQLRLQAPTPPTPAGNYKLSGGGEQRRNDHHTWSFMAGTILRLLMEKPRDFWEDLGLQVFGPLFLGNILWTAQRARHDRVEKLLFFARDAYLPHQVFSRYPALLPAGVEIEYAYFSRSALLLPSFVDLPVERLYHLFSGKNSRTVGYHLQKLTGQAPASFTDQIRRAGFESAEDRVKNGDYRMIRLLQSVVQPFLLQARQQRELPARYVQQLSKGVKHLGIVDIGWTGNMQGGFSRLLQLSRTDFDINGYYFGTFELLRHNYLPRNRYHGYLVNEDRPRRLSHSLFSGGVELLEFAMMAPHGTTLGYADQNGSIQPLLEDNRDDENMRELAARVQQGAIEFIDASLPFILQSGIDAFVSNRWAEPFFRLVDQPDDEEAVMLGELTHSDSASDTSQRMALAAKLPGPVIREQGPAFAKAREQAFWKAGFDRRNTR